MTRAGRWRQMQDPIGQARETTQTGPVVEIAKQRNRPGRAPERRLIRLAHQGVDAVTASETGENAASDVAAADNQDFLHAGIVADDPREPMSYQITIQPSGRQFAADADESLLDAALRHGLTLPHGCKDGVCGACKGQVLAGVVDHGRAQPHCLSDEEKAAGQALFCCATARSDLTIECQQIATVSAIPAKTLPARIEKLERLAPDVIALHLRLPANERLQFYAGQYINILLKDGKRRSFSLANAPHANAHDSALLQLHIRRIPGGVFTEQVFTTLKVRDILRFNGPHGSFHWREDSPRPVILLAGGTGFAPLKAIVEQARAEGCQRPMTLYWGARDRAGLYLDALPRQWAADQPHFRYVPVLSEPTAADAWNGRVGLVHHAVMADFPDLSGHQVYACGAPAMIDAARADFTQRCGLPTEEFFADAFSFAAN